MIMTKSKIIYYNIVKETINYISLHVVKSFFLIL